MRVDLTPQRLDLTPGFSHSVILTVTNTESIIAGFGIRVLGADPGWVQLPTEHLSLFPDEVRNVEIVIDPPRGMPAGSRRLAVQVRELTEPYASTITEIDLVVPALPQTQVRVDPLVVTAGKRATYSLLVENTGNTDLTGYLSGDDPESRVAFAFEPERIVLAPGQHAVVDMRASSKRAIFGSPAVRSLSLYLDPQRQDAMFTPLAAQQAASGDEREPVASATFIQKSVMARGALSLLGLLFAATVFAIVITLALSRLVAQSTADRNLALQVAAAKDAGAATSGSSGVAGTVRLLTSGTPVPGVAVSVFDESDTSVAIATTATDDKGAYSVTDLAAGKYKLSFRGAGFVQLWYPGAATDADATTVTLNANQVQGGLNVSLGGVPATISGSVSGDDVGAATLFLERPASGTTANVARAAPLTAPVTPVTPPDNGAAVVQQVPIGSDGTFTLTNVPSPSVYDLVVVKQGYATSTQRIDVGAGETRKGVQLTLVQGDGLISGTVTDGTGGLGGATITATSGQTSASTVSLTGARAGTFTLRSLTTPASYTLIVSRAGFAAQTLSVSLSAEQQLVGVDVTLSKSSAKLTGKVTQVADGKGAGGVSVAITNGQVTVQTVTNSTDDVGTWSIAGLPAPGSYTATFSRSDLQSQTVSISLDASGTVTPGSIGARVSSDGVAVSMQSSTATVAGTVFQKGGGRVCAKKTGALGEASVSLSTGSTSYSVTTASVSPHCGQYRLEHIPAGTYTLTASTSSGTTPTSTVVTVAAGVDQTIPITLSSPASLAGAVFFCSVNPQPGTTCPVASRVGRPGYSVFLYLRSNYPGTVARTVTTTGSNGAFLFNDIDAGSYVLAAGPTTDPSNATNTTSVTVQPSQARTGVLIRVSQ